MSIRPNDRLNYIILFLKNWIARKPQWGVVKPQRVVFFHIEYHIGVWYYPMHCGFQLLDSFIR